MTDSKIFTWHGCAWLNDSWPRLIGATWNTSEPSQLASLLPPKMHRWTDGPKRKAPNLNRWPWTSQGSVRSARSLWWFRSSGDLPLPWCHCIWMDFCGLERAEVSLLQACNPFMSAEWCGKASWEEVSVLPVSLDSKNFAAYLREVDFQCKRKPSMF